MLSTFHQFIAKLPHNRTITAFIIGLFAALVTTFSKYIFVDAWHLNLTFGIGICTFIVVWLLHYLIFIWLKSHKLKCALILAFPIVYIGFLITAFAAVTTLVNLTWFQVPLINQVYLQMWAFLGDAYIYAVFSPKISYVLTCLLVILSFCFALVQSHTQPEQD